MKRLSIRYTASLLLLALGIVMSTHTASAQTSIDGAWNIAELMTEAENNFDVSSNDAIFLLDSKEVHWLDDSSLEQHIHRIIWIGSDVAVDSYCDHRIPYDHDNTELEVTALRTWRGGQWWTTGETGIVETLPHALRNAYDYTNMREMMLLHDGVEIPCIIEVRYIIRDKAPFRKWADGLWIFSKENPAVVSRFALSDKFADQGSVSHSEGVSPENTDGLLVWQETNLHSNPRPATSDPAAYLSHVAWSTAKSWDLLGEMLTAQINSGSEIDNVLSSKVDSLRDESLSDYELAANIAEFIDNRTRLVDYSSSWWWQSPRTAGRTYSTAYCHVLDRLILAKTLFDKANIDVNPIVFFAGHGDVTEANKAAPNLQRFGQIGLELPFGSVYDPGSSSIMSGVPKNRCIWRLDSDPDCAGSNAEGLLHIAIDLSFDDESGRFVGTGALKATGFMSPYYSMRGLGREASGYLSGLASSVIDGARVNDHNVVLFEPDDVEAGFTFEIEKPEPDDLGRITLRAASPSGGIIGITSGNLYDQEHQSPIQYPGVINQVVEVRLNTEDLDVIYYPASDSLRNTVGAFRVTAEEDEGKCTIVRHLSLNRDGFSGVDWPLLRALLLSEDNEKNGTIVFKTEASDNDD